MVFGYMEPVSQIELVAISITLSKLWGQECQIMNVESQIVCIYNKFFSFLSGIISKSNFKNEQYQKIHAV